MRASELELRIPADCIGGFVEVFGGDYSAPVKITGPVTVLDIGANVGAFALWASVQWPQATIYSYEPHPDLFPLLEHNTKHIDHCKRFNCAVGNPDRTALFERDDSRLCCTQFNRGDSTRTVPIAVIKPEVLPLADIVKVDAEGAEWDIIRALQFTPRLMIVEWHTDSARSSIDSWATYLGMMLVKSRVSLRHLGISIYAKEVA